MILVLERRVPSDEPCVSLLMHWNSEREGGKGESHEFVARRLRQLGRQDLADWISKSSFTALGHDLTRQLNSSFKEKTTPAGPVAEKRETTPLITKAGAGSTTISPGLADMFASRRIAK